jgi:hypothetical protein
LPLFGLTETTAVYRPGFSDFGMRTDIEDLSLAFTDLDDNATTLPALFLTEIVAVPVSFFDSS